jgi:hypothetical protein
MTLERCAIEELGIRPDRGNGREFIDDDPVPRLAAKHRQKGDGRIIAIALFDCGFAAFGNHIQNDILARSFFCAKLKSPIGPTSRLQLSLPLPANMPARQAQPSFSKKAALFRFSGGGDELQRTMRNHPQGRLAQTRSFSLDRSGTNTSFPAIEI